jgi:dTDP-4-amino-4,6-dideoxygalactose transaminase
LIKLFDPVISKEEEIAVRNTLYSKFWASGAGTGNVLKFETAFKNYTKSKSCVTVNSGTAALHLALSLIDIRGKEVILPSLSFVSTAHAVMYNGGVPVFVDVEPNSLCIDPNEIENLITKKTKIILPVHFAGMPCALTEMKKLCVDHNLILIEDAAHAAGSTYKNKRIGSHGNMVCFSFHPVKNLAMPTGGAITLNDNNWKADEELLKSKRWCGIADRRGVMYNVPQIGWNFYMNEFSAAIGLVQLKRLNSLNSKRRKNVKRYNDEMKLEMKMPYNKDCSYHFYWIRVKNRELFMKKMKENGIETGIHYKPIHTMQYYNKKIKLANTDAVADEIVSLPTHPNLSEDDVTKLIKCVNLFA